MKSVSDFYHNLRHTKELGKCLRGLDSEFHQVALEYIAQHFDLWQFATLAQAEMCQEIEEIRRICWEGTDRARHLKFDELSVQQERDPNTVSQLLTVIQDLHNKLNSLSDARDFHDPETASISGASHVPSQPLTIPSPR